MRVSVWQFLEDLLADRVVDLGQRREVEVAAEELDELRPRLRLQGLDEVAEVGFVQLFDEKAQPRRVPRLDGAGDLLDEALDDIALLVTEGEGDVPRIVGRAGRRILVDVQQWAGPCEGDLRPGGFRGAGQPRQRVGAS